MVGTSADIGTATRPRLELRIGVTGHRPPRLPADHLARIREETAGLFAQISKTLADIHRDHCDLFSPEPPRVVLISPLAAGSDSLAARAAVDAGFVLEATLPFDSHEYRKDFGTDEAREFDSLLSSCTRVLTLPGPADDREEAYRAVGALNAAQCDILLGIWDGEPSRGTGGAADVIADAVSASMPVLMIDANDAVEPSLLWNGADSDPHDAPTLDTVARQPAAPTLPRLLASLLAPPADARALIADLAETPTRRFVQAIAYPFLLAITGARSWRSAFAQPDYEGSAAQIRPLIGCCGPEGPFTDAERDLLLPRFAVADWAANRFAPRYRGGFIGNFLLAALAVACGLAGLLVPEGKPVFVAAELVTILIIVIRTRSAVKAGWHRRWIDTRQLAELIRVLPLSAALGDLTLLHGEGVDEAMAPAWYARATARELGLGEGAIDTARIAAVREQTLALIADQVGYHHNNAARMDKMDHRTRHFGEWLFVITMLACIAWLIAKPLGLAYATMAGVNFTMLITVLTSLLPAIGAALYGIRMQGDFAGSAERSRAIRSRLERLSAAIQRDPLDYHRLTSRLRRLTEIMLAEVDQWRQLSEVRPLELPG